MKIGFDASDLCTMRADGTTRYTEELVKRLPGFGSEYEWLFFGPGQAPQGLAFPAPPSGAHEALRARRGAPGAPPAARWISSPWPRYWTQSRFPLELYRYRPDVLFMPIQQLPALRPGKMKTVAVIHDLAFHIYPEQFTYKDWLLQHVFTAYAARNADQIICVSQATANDVAKFYGRTKNVSVIHHGVDHGQFKSQKSKVKTGKPYILYVGQIQPRKNIERLVEAFSHFAKASRDSAQSAPELVIAGGHGWLQEPIFEAIKKSPFADRIKVLGPVSQDKLVELYQNAEVFVLPSLYEGFGMPILEAMASGCPVVTSNVSSMPEVALLRQGYGGQAGYAAVLVDPLSVESIANGIEEARRRAPELREKGLARAREFSWDKTAQETFDVLLR